jgi:hypothetical protein
VDSTLPPGIDGIRTWRRATLLAGSVAAVEFVLVVVLAAIVVTHAFPGSGAPHPTLATRATIARVRPVSAPAVKAASVPATRLIPPDRVRIVVLNGNGLSGAAATAATGLRRRGYRIAGVANAAHQNYPTSLILYRPGYRPEGMRLARELGIHVVGPLDGMSLSALRGGELAVILGA